MSTLLLRLAGPLQSWGSASRFTRRETRAEPTRSGVLGLLAAAQGRRRTDSLEDLLDARFGVRVDQPGHVIRDFQTAHRWATGESMPLSHRYYLSDAVFVAAVEGPHELVTALDAAIGQPRFPLFLGRRSCPPSRPVRLGVVEDGVEDALRGHPWEAAVWYREKQATHVRLRLVTDAWPDEPRIESETVRDVPVSFDSRRREYVWRDVVERPPVEVPNPAGRRAHEDDYFAAVLA